MALNIGSTYIDSIYLGSTKIGAAYLGNVKVYSAAPVDPYNPLGLPPFTIRCKFTSDYTPTMGDSQTLVDATENVWDITKNSTDWSYLFYEISDLLEVLGANATGVTSMSFMFAYCDLLTSVALFDTSACASMRAMFAYCDLLTSVPLFDTSACTAMNNMFAYSGITTVPLFNTSSCTNMSAVFNSCRNLTSVPLFNTSSCTNMTRMFYTCYNVQSGALALYQQASTQTTPPTSHNSTFTGCGRDTVTGAQELSQIPTSWGGTMS